MGRRRFWSYLLVGLLLSIGIACSGPTPEEMTAPTVVSDVASAETTAVSESAPAELSPETQALVASAGPGGLSDPPRGDMRLVVVSDLNGVYGSTDYDPEVDKAMQLVPFWRPDLVVCTGDMVAGQDLTLTPEQISAMWQAFDQHVAAPLRQAGLPYGLTIGNHDASSALGVNNQFLFQRERDLAADYWNQPQHDPGLEFVDRYEFPFYYTFQQGDIFFISWDASSNRIPEDQLAWVEQALASEAAQQAKMRILLGHLPLYAVAIGRDQPGDVMADADQLRALLERYDVHVYISGHHHAYYPGHRGNLQLLHTGILGGGPRPLIEGDLPPRKTLTVVDVDFDSPQLTRYTTYDMQTLAIVEHEPLPRLLMGHNGVVLRRDLRWESLDASEKALCEERLGKALCTF